MGGYLIAMEGWFFFFPAQWCVYAQILGRVVPVLHKSFLPLGLRQFLWQHGVAVTYMILNLASRGRSAMEIGLNPAAEGDIIFSSCHKKRLNPLRLICSRHRSCGSKRCRKCDRLDYGGAKSGAF